MSNPLENYNENNNFWEFNPQYKVIFKDLYSKDKSKNKDKTSTLMWGLLLYVHPKSDFYNLPDKEELIAKDIFKDSKFKWEDYTDTIKKIKDITLSQAEKSLVVWDETLKKRDKFIHSQEFTLDTYIEDPETGRQKLLKGTADQLDKMLANTVKLYDEYTKILKQLTEEEQTKGKGGNPISLMDAGII